MKDDIELEEGGSEDLPDSNTVKELIDECMKSVENHSMTYYAQALYNERMVSGDQKSVLNDYRLGQDANWPVDSPFVSRNLLRNMQLTWSSRILEERPNIKCYPAEPGTDEIKAQKCDKILEFVRQNQDWDNLNFEAAQLVQVHSCVGFKAVWDPLYGPPSQGIPLFDENNLPVIDPATGLQSRERVGEPLGDVRWEVVSIFDYGTDGSEDIANSKWCYFVKYINKIEASHILKSANIQDKPNEEEYVDSWGIKRKGVKVVELWWKPDYRFPKGLFCYTVGGVAVQAMDFPYDHSELPLAVWKCGPRRDSPYGSTHVDDAVYIQRTINEIVAAMARQARQVRDIKLLAPSKVVEQIEDGNQMLKVDDFQLLNATKYLEPPDLAASLVRSLEDNVQALYTVYGLNEVLTGASSIKSGTAAKSIAYLNKLDSMKMAGASRSLSKAILRIMRQTLKLYQQFVKAPRIAHITGDNNVLSAELFSEADISGVDVRMEPITGFDNYRATVAENASVAMQSQGPTPELQSQQKTGLVQTSYDKAQREVVQSEIQAILQGNPVEPDSSIDGNIAVDEIMKVASQYRGTQYGVALMQLLQRYMANIQQQPVEGQQQ